MANVRTMIVVWLSAIGLASAAVAALLAVPPLPQMTFQPPPFAVIIGSSLVGAAFPAEYRASALFPDSVQGDRIIRISQPYLSEPGIVNLLHRAAEGGVRKVLIQVDPLLRTYRFQQEPSGIAAFSNRLRLAVLDGTGFASPLLEAPDARVYDGDTRDLAANFYTARAHSPRNLSALRNALAAAKRNGTEVIWIAMPRTQTAAEFLGPSFEIAFAGELKKFANRFSAVVWRPARSWPNELFVDQAHMNEGGRARFVNELSRFLSTPR